MQLRGSDVALVVLALVAVVAVISATLAVAHVRQVATQVASPALQGTDLRGVAAPSFTLVDQSGARLSLAALHGHLVVLTFMDSVCTNECPITAQYLDMSAQLLGAKDTTSVVWLAISVDPWSDTSATARAFLAKNQVTMPLHFLLGSEATLRPLWQAYHIAVLQTGGDITHTLGAYIIDQRGRERIWLDQAFDPKMLSDDLRILLEHPA
jgi:protein SCO1